MKLLLRHSYCNGTADQSLEMCECNPVRRMWDQTSQPVSLKLSRTRLDLPVRGIIWAYKSNGVADLSRRIPILIERNIPRAEQNHLQAFTVNSLVNFHPLSVAVHKRSRVRAWAYRHLARHFFVLGKKNLKLGSYSRLN